METRIINRARGLGVGRPSTRYRRLRFADDIAVQIAELEDERREDRYDRYDRDEDDWRHTYDPRSEHFESLLPELQTRIRAAAPFHRLPMSASPRVARVSEPNRGEGSIEDRLFVHYDRLTTHGLDAWLVGEGVEDDLTRLEAIADEQLGGSLGPLVGLLLVRPLWIRSLASWAVPVGVSRRCVIVSLVEHLLVEFVTPRWLCNAWLSESGELGIRTLRWMTWLIVLGQGGSLRGWSERAAACWPGEWRALPSKLTATLSAVPDTFMPARGMLLAEIVRLGGSEIELRRIEGDRSFVLDPSAADVDEHELEFWRATVRWLVRERDRLDDATTPMILAWARHMQTERQRQAGHSCGAARTGRGSFEWRGRTVASVRREAEAYRQVLAVPWSRQLSWRDHGWDWQGRFDGQEWTIRELRTSAALRAESLAMSHCVRIYDLACWRGHTAIFSVMIGDRRCVTVELGLGSRTVVQVKRACNQAASASELAVIEHWRTTVVDPVRT